MKQRNKHSYDTHSIQQRILPILKTFDQVCKEHNLTYYLWAGTQLGAVRHAGFIPWDDDADVAMPRKDYNILMAHAHEWMPSSFQIATNDTVERYPHYFARVQDCNTTMVIRKHLGYVEGLHIDIFPLDNVPQGSISRFFHFAKLGLLHRLLYISTRSPHKDKSRCKAAFYNFMQRRYRRETVLRWIESHIQKPNRCSSPYCSDSFYSSHAFLAHATLGSPTPYLFEGVELMGVEFAHTYLTDKYGDYMSPPPEQGRKQHSVDFIDFDLPFAQFDIETLDND